MEGKQRNYFLAFIIPSLLPFFLLNIHTRAINCNIKIFIHTVQLDDLRSEMEEDRWLELILKKGRMKVDAHKLYRRWGKRPVGSVCKTKSLCQGGILTQRNPVARTRF